LLTNIVDDFLPRKSLANGLFACPTLN